MDRLKEDDPHREKLFSLSCEVGVTKCAQIAKAEFAKWAADPKYK